MRLPRVFISYVHQDVKLVMRLVRALKKNDIEVWLDRESILPGMQWKQAIRRAVTEGDYFIACFSPSYTHRGATYMNEELTLAVDILRQKSLDQTWFIPVLLAECEVPDREIGGGSTLHDIQHVRLYEGWEEGIRRIISVVKPGSDTPKPKMPRKPRQNNEKSVITVLFLAADPDNVTHLSLSRELREIQLSLRLSNLGERFHLEVRTAATPQDLREALIGLKPNIVHLAGHGVSDAIILQDDSGRAQPVDAETLAALFGGAGYMPDCLLISASMSASLAKVLAGVVKWVIAFGMLSDESAVHFSSGFYQALGAGQSIEQAFRFGSVAIRLQGSSEGDEPMLIPHKARHTGVARGSTHNQIGEADT